MINMMYLVLTAMLAMNVSAEILAAFERLRDKLEVSSQTAVEGNKSFVRAMKEAIRKEVDEQKEMKNSKLPDTLDMLTKKTEEMIGFLDIYLAKMEEIGVIDPITGKIVNKDEHEVNQQYWLGQGAEQETNGGSGSGKARELRAQMDAYSAYIVGVYNKVTAKLMGADKKPLPPLPLDSLTIKDPTAAEIGPEAGGVAVKWERHTFEGPVVANLATLEAMKIEVYSMQKMLLDQLNQRLGAIPVFKADKVVGMDAPVSTVVTAGMQFETKIFAVMTSSQLKPKFSASTGKLTEDPANGSAKLVIPASASVIPKDQNQGTISYSASIQVPKATGGFENLQIQGKFTVRKPEIVITSASVQNLYRACGNAINIDVPALGDLYNPVVTGSGAEVQGSAQSKKKWLIVPSGDRCVINVKSNTNGQMIDIGNVDYKVIEPPKPTIMMKVNGQPYNGSTPVTSASKICFSILADAEFKSALPQDARYELGEIEILAQLGLGAPQKVGAENCAGRDAAQDICVSMGPQVRQAAPGTKVYFRVNGVFRKNFKGAKIEDKRFPEIERTKSLVTKQ